MTDTATYSSIHGPAEIDLELFTFVERYATTLFRWDLILFFGRNPDKGWTAAEVAKQLRRSVVTTTKEMDELTYLKVLVRHYAPDRITFRLSRRGVVRRAATRLAALDAKPEHPSTA